MRISAVDATRRLAVAAYVPSERPGSARYYCSAHRALGVRLGPGDLPALPPSRRAAAVAVRGPAGGRRPRVVRPRRRRRHAALRLQPRRGRDAGDDRRRFRLDRLTARRRPPRSAGRPQPHEDPSTDEIDPLALRLAAALAVAAVLAAASPAIYAAVVSGTVNTNISFGQQITTSVTPYTAPAAAQFTNTYSNGTGSNQVDTLYAKAIVLSAAPTTVDLTNFTDVGGNTSVSLARVREWSSTTWTPTRPTPSRWPPAAPTAGPCSLPNGAPRRSPPTAASCGSATRRPPDRQRHVVTSSSKTVTFNPGSNTVTIYVIAAGGSAAFAPILFLVPSGRRLRRYRRAA